MDAIKKTLAPILAQLQKLPPTARKLLAAVAGIGVVVAIALAVSGGEPKRVLFSGLDAKDASAVVAALDSAKIEYELGAGGSTVRVPESEVDRARLLLAEQDLPATGNVGFEMFEEQSFGLTDFAQQVNYRRALQGELERTIEQIEAVSAARVHVTLPRKAVFEDEKIPPTASVTLDLLRGRDLADRSVGAIRHLVASAVEGLEPGGVTVVDTRGNLLSRADTGNEVATAALDYENDIEIADGAAADAAARAHRRRGRGRRCRWQRRSTSPGLDTTEEVYDPEQTAVVSESTQQTVENARAGPGRRRRRGGRPTPLAGAGGAGGPGKGNSRMVQSKQYEVNKTVVRTVGPGATLKRLTVAVLVDGTYTEPEDGGEPVFAPRSEEELGELQAVVENAIGFNAARGDSDQDRERAVQGSAGPGRDRPAARGSPDGMAALRHRRRRVLAGRRRSPRRAAQTQAGQGGTGRGAQLARHRRPSPGRAARRGRGATCAAGGGGRAAAVARNPGPGRRESGDDRGCDPGLDRVRSGVDDAKRASAEPKKAVTLLLSLGEENAARVLHFLDERTVRALSDCIDSMESVSREQAEAVYSEFHSIHKNNAIPITSGARVMRRIARKVLGSDKADDLLAREIEAPQPLRVLNRIRPGDAGELAQQGARTEPRRVAGPRRRRQGGVGSQAPAQRLVQQEVVQRMASLEAIPHTTTRGGRAGAARRAGPGERGEGWRRSTASSARRRPGVAPRLRGRGAGCSTTSTATTSSWRWAIKRSMFTFEDLLKVDNRDLQTVLKEVSTDQLRVALKTASPEMRDHVLGAMSRRAAEMLMDDLESMGPMKLSKVEEAQGEIVEAALKLQTEGKIAIAGAGGEEMV